VAELTPSQTVGPFFEYALTTEPLDAELVARDAPGAICIEGSVLDGEGEPVPDAMLELWQPEGFARAGTDAEGRFRFVTVKPSTHGEAAPHIVACVFARGLLHHLWTRIYFSEEQDANASDPLLQSIGDEQIRNTLIAQPDGACLRFDVHLQGERQTCFLAL
jgi:protocatechuate 3,4-dioxygenase, alpha subunit